MTKCLHNACNNSYAQVNPINKEHVEQEEGKNGITLSAARLQ